MAITTAGEPAQVSESARATSREESAFRIEAPNSEPRNILVVALEADAARLLTSIAGEEWRRTSFRSSVWLQDAAHPNAGELKEWFDIVAGHAEDLIGEIASSDVVVMITTAGDSATGASAIGEACAARAVKTSGIIIQKSDTPPEILTQSLHDLRPWTATLSVIAESDMVVDMIHALGACTTSAESRGACPSAACWTGSAAWAWWPSSRWPFPWWRVSARRICRKRR